ncbi:MAG: tryptophan synthase subunit alpha [Veillonella sp.]|uniref:tryptophan synthase subunit alpha n=1 Tax=Veillonella sp. TaxID=1926307 RepID=UPI0025E53741|nr:tryptophan synthase subunit alpha [Veillonella sp.]MBS4913062.1 tryptophan synthase subunit alpha [Veillonella sp.]
MNKIEEIKVQQGGDSYDIACAFENKKSFIAFLTAGDPNLDATARYIEVMADAGADLIEVGIPFSDPAAEGPVIQAASERALKAGTTMDKIFDMVEKVRRTVTIPLVFMTYLNPVFVYGAERFFKRCKELNVRGLIVPDMPFEEKDTLSAQADEFGVALISLIAPTSAQRIEMIAKEAQGFIYCVSSLGVTGMRKEITTDIHELVGQIKRYTDVPVAIGFGIAEPAQAETMARLSDGVIVGSAIVNIIAQHGDNADEALHEYVGAMKAAAMKGME